ncbi:MAG: FKBP-type peptidyl-prolyl cis-trans isomerase [Gammaproteobacteria bacterium]
MIRKNLTKIFVLLASSFALSATLQAAEPKTEDEKTFYFLGTAISQNLKMLNLSDKEVEMVLAGLRDSLTSDALELNAALYNERLRTISEQRVSAMAEKERVAGQAYVQQMANEKGAVQTDSGLVYLEIKAGKGESPTATSQVKANYHGTLRDGTVFDSSVDRSEPITIGLNQVIPCWTEGIAMMKVGGKAKLTCPSAIAYGDRGQGAIMPNSALTFEVELIEIVNIQ